jgi:hypothetical protein
MSWSRKIDDPLHGAHQRNVTPSHRVATAEESNENTHT